MTPAEVTRIVRADVRAGRSWIATFGRGDEAPRLDFRGPRGMRGSPDFFRAEPPLLRLWPSCCEHHPLAVVAIAANDALASRLVEVESRARPLVGAELPFLVALLAGLREGVLGARPRVPIVGEAGTRTARPTSPPGLPASRWAISRSASCGPRRDYVKFDPWTSP